MQKSNQYKKSYLTRMCKRQESIKGESEEGGAGLRFRGNKERTGNSSGTSYSAGRAQFTDAPYPCTFVAK